MHENLLRELRDLAREAESFLDIMAGENMLPEDFPKEQLQNYMQALIGLQKGSQDGCKVPLEQMRNELPRIRRENIVDQETLAEKYSALGEDDLPPLERGGKLDNGLKSVLSQVSVAYDEYRVTVSDTGPEPEINQQAASIDIGIEETTPLIADSKALETKLNSDIELVSNHLDKTQDNREETKDFKESLEDAKNANFVVRGFLGGKKIVRRWYRASINGLYASGEKIEKTGTNLKKLGLPIAGVAAIGGAPIAGVALTLVGIKEFGIQLESFGKYLDDKHRNIRLENSNDAPEPNEGSEKYQYPPNITPEEEKVAARQARKLLRKGLSVPDEIAQRVRYLNLYTVRFQDTRLIKNFIWLKELHIHRKNIRNWEGLTELNNLEKIFGSASSIRDLSFLENMPNLRELDLSYTNVGNSSVLEKMEKLEKLNLARTRITNFKFLEKHQNLQSLNLNRTSFSDKDGIFIENLEKLKALNLSYTKITSDFGEVLKNLENLEELNLSSTALDDEIAPIIGKLIKLEHLHLNHTQIGKPIVHETIGLINLLYIDLRKTNVSDKDQEWVKKHLDQELIGRIMKRYERRRQSNQGIIPTNLT